MDSSAILKDGHVSIQEIYQDLHYTPYIGSMSFWLSKNVDRN